MLTIKSIATTIILLFVYNILIIIYKPQQTAPQNLWQNNIIKAQKYIYEYHEKEIVIVGSSLADRLKGEILPESAFNLSFSASSIYDGLSIVEISNAAPKILLIETNFINRPLKKDFIEDLFHPLLFKMRYIFPALREQYQPMNLFASTGLFWRMNATIELFFKYIIRLSTVYDRAEKKPNKAPPQKIKKPVDKKILEIAINLHSRLPDKQFLGKKLKELKQFVDSLQNRGIIIAFFEMPMHPEISNSPSINFIREEFCRIFPKTQYTFLSNPDSSSYTTTDGHHLDNESAIAYTKKFKEDLDSIRKGLQ